ncbi:oxysterol-binding protein [Tricharina praecox]|uniref:oxysterol-binding protein n=1 Tax=Tricharina praecox TaxID=43433 RepID=UPI00222049E5|nr:oxysterol-binding protein [Tricharina praecox]KAI5844942.1 oxysterol-binding protein [Tricharina praecox]
MFSGLVGGYRDPVQSTHARRRSSLNSNKSGGDAGESEEEMIVDDSEKSMLMAIISQLRPGADLSRITLPTFILEPRSMLERITNFMQHPETLLPMSTIDDPEQRFVSVVKFYLSGWHIKPAGVKKPLNPILGERFTCHWDFAAAPGTQAFYIAEQTSHHPPKSSYFYMAPHHHIRIDGTLKPQSRFLGNSAASMMNTSVVIMRLLNRGTSAGKQGGGEKYILTQPNMYVRGILFGKMKYELGDHAYVRCSELDLVADIEFKVKGFFTGAYNAIGGFIKRESTGENLYEITGSWNADMYIKNLMTGKREPLFDATQTAATPPTVRPIEKQDERESQRLWYEVVSALKRRDQDVATAEKCKIEDRQREEARLREADGVEWQPRYFRPVEPGTGDEDALDFILATHINEEASPEEQIKQILQIAPIVDGEPRPSKYDIPPHHPHNDAPHQALPIGNTATDTPGSESGLIDFSPQVVGQAPASLGGPQLVPTDKGIAPAGQPKPRSVNSDDEFVDAQS